MGLGEMGLGEMVLGEMVLGDMDIHQPNDQHNTKSMLILKWPTFIQFDGYAQRDINTHGGMSPRHIIMQVRKILQPMTTCHGTKTSLAKVESRDR
jgi:hypothetical protein